MCQQLHSRLTEMQHREALGSILLVGEFPGELERGFFGVDPGIVDHNGTRQQAALSTRIAVLRAYRAKRTDEFLSRQWGARSSARLIYMSGSERWRRAAAVHCVDQPGLGSTTQ